jgi:hypothetical protein
MIDESELFLGDVMTVLNGQIIEILQQLSREVNVYVAGGKSLEVMLKREYMPGKTVDWDVNIASPDINITNEEARDYAGEEIIKALTSLRTNYNFRLDLIEKKYDTKISEFKYEVNPNIFTAYTGDKYTIGHVDIVTDKYGLLGIVDLVPGSFFNVEDFIKIDGINYLDIPALRQTLITLLELPKYKKKDKALKRIQAIDAALEEDGLSCNFYRAHIVQKGEAYEEELGTCMRSVVLGPQDPLLPHEVRLFNRFNISDEDIRRHNKYFKELAPSKRKIVEAYTAGQSAAWNNKLNHNSLFPEEAYELEPEIQKLQNIILSAPPLTKDAYVFMVNRVFYIPHEDRFNTDIEVGEVVKRHSFTSTTFDNEYNPRPFFDLFAPGVAFAIKLKAGSRVLIIGDNSKYKNEAEVLLPFNSNLVIEDKALEEVTYLDGSSLWYDEMVTYFCTYKPEIRKKTVNVSDISLIRNHQHFDRLLDIKDFAEIFSKLWYYNNIWM